MPLALLVNPHSARGKTLKLLPRVEAALDARRIVFRVQKTRGLEHGVEQALRAVEAGEVPVVMSGDGLVGQIGGALAGAETPLGILPGGRGNDLARVLGIPDEPEGAVEMLAAGNARQIDVGEVNGRRFLGIASVASTPMPTGSPTRPAVLRGNLVYVYAALRTLLRLEAGTLHDPRRRGASRASPATRSRSPTTRPSAAACSSRRTPSWTTASSTSSRSATVGKLRFLANLPKVFKGTHVEEDEVRVFRAPPTWS